MNRASNPAVHAHHEPGAGLGAVGHFLRHLGEMTLAMMVGMAAAMPVLWLLFGVLLAPRFQGLTREEALARYPVLIPVVVCLVMAVAMTAPMAAWMRHRGHGWRSCAEMAAAMAAPLVPIFALLGLGVLPGAAACCAYCATMVLAMIADMLYRRAEYTHHAPAPGLGRQAAAA